MKKLTGGDAIKVAKGGLLWKKTTASRAWIAEKLSMKRAADVEMAIRRMKNGEMEPDYSRELKDFIAHANESH